MYIESQDMEPYKTFLVMFDSTKLNSFMHNNSVKNIEKNMSRDDEEAHKNSKSSCDMKK